MWKTVGRKEAHPSSLKGTKGSITWRQLSNEKKKKKLDIPADEDETTE